MWPSINWYYKSEAEKGQVGFIYRALASRLNSRDTDADDDDDDDAGAVDERPPQRSHTAKEMETPIIL